MCRPARWLPGLIPLFLLFLAAVGLKVPEIRHDLTARTGAALAGAGLSEGAIDVSGRDVTLKGMAFADDGPARATATADSVDGVRLVTNGITLAAEAKPYTFSAARDGAKVVLSGVVPGPGSRAKLLAAAKGVAPEVEDHLTYARGAAAGFDAWAAAALAPLGDLPKGEARLSDGALSVSGESADIRSYDSAVAKAKALPAGLKLAGVNISAPAMSPFAWAATARDGKTLMLEGGVPSEEARAAILAAAKAALPGLTVVDRMQPARGAAGGFVGWTQTALAALSKLSRGRASLMDSALHIVGEAGDAASYQAALAATKSLPVGLSLGAAQIQAPMLSPYPWSASSDGKTLTLEGAVPSEEARAAIIAAAKAANPGLAIVDRMQIARGADGGFLDAAKTALKALGQLSAGKASLSDLKLALSGFAKPGESLESLGKWLMGALPQGFSLGEMGVRYPEHHPFAFGATKGADGKIVASGFAPSEALRTAALAAARAAGSSYSGDATLASGWPAGMDFGASAAFGANLLSKFRSGEMSLGEDGLTIRGEVDEASAVAIRALLAALPAGVKVKAVDLKVLAPAQPAAQADAAAAPAQAPSPVRGPARDLTASEAACQQQLATRLNAEKIRFRTASAEIDASSEGLVRDLAAVLKSCSEVKLEVEGHTDSMGAAEMNKDLSIERAKSVVAALVEAGVAVDRLSASGFGQERPIASNDTAEGRALNRRTEFVLK